MQQGKQRLLGVDALRGIAVFAVIVLHIDDGLLSIPEGWQYVSSFFGFPVPFFLAASFYLATHKASTQGKAILLAPRIARLLFPYLSWSIFYLVYKISKYFIDRDLEQLTSLFDDPTALIFFGGAGFHLYFLPLLLVGTILLKLLGILISQRYFSGKLVTCAFLSLFFYEILLSSGNSYQTIAASAFNSLFRDFTFESDIRSILLRLVLVIFSWSIRCMPYALFAIVACTPRIDGYLRQVLCFRYTFVFLLISFIALSLFWDDSFLPALNELIKGYLALTIALALSYRIKGNYIIQSIGVCSFGIYLVHLLYIDMLYIVKHRLGFAILTEPTVSSLLFLSIIVFLVSWSTVHLIRQLPCKLVHKIV